ncbi:hypothetical protein CEXT_4761 [Caerostris extrusa]|uniref:Uncharacterized protein n=1 Tax=Caerostris extrusa TaxID=172846 RepID=A0AAV4N341_CAEEX|nr:hypothetical protein CEXT_4761 [Caerostris extrusa]
MQRRYTKSWDIALGADSCSSVGDLNELMPECVLKEGNRLYPPGPCIGRKISEHLTGLWRDGSESPGVSHSEKLLPSLSGLEDQVLPVARLKVSNRLNPPASSSDADNSDGIFNCSLKI